MYYIETPKHWVIVAIRKCFEYHVITRAFVREVGRRPNRSTKYLEAIEPRRATITPIGHITMCRLRSVASAFRYYCLMLDTDSAMYDLIFAPVLAAALHYRPMLDTDSALFDLIDAPVLAAVFAFPRTPLLAILEFRYSRPMLVTDSALLNLIVAPFLAAVFAFGQEEKHHILGSPHISLRVRYM